MALAGHPRRCETRLLCMKKYFWQAYGLSLQKISLFLRLSRSLHFSLSTRLLNILLSFLFLCHSSCKKKREKKRKTKSRWWNLATCHQYSPSASEYRLILSECHMARGAHGWLSLHICRAAGDPANIDEVNRAHRGPYHELNISRYSRRRGEYCT